MRGSIIAPIREGEPMRLSRITAVVVALLAVAVVLADADAQQCPKGKLRFYTSWPMQGAMIPEGTGMKNGVDLAVSEVDGVVAGHCLEVVNLDDASPQTGKWRSEEHTSELQSRLHLVCRLLLEKKKTTTT